VLTADQKELDRLSENSLHLIQSHDIDTTIEIFEGLYRGDPQDPEESADNLATYSLPIGQLSKRVSRSIMLARKRSAELRARAEEAREEVRERIEVVREDVVFAAKRIEIRVRKSVKKAADRLRREGQ
jgi:hypothetical protein